MIYVVLGMHKSGTTLVSQILHHSGINMGDGIDVTKSYDQGNVYERASTKALNQEILHCENKYSLDIGPPKRLCLTDGLRARMRHTIRDISNRHTDWGFKDPRTCLVYPAWASELPKHKVIAIYRPIDEVWARYRPRNPVKNPCRAWRLAKRWYQYNCLILDSFQRMEKSDRLALNFGSLVTTAAEFERLERFTGVELSDQRRAFLYRGTPRARLAVKAARWAHQTLTRSDFAEVVRRFETYRS
jgi:hypothetical protein